jgi:tRNA (guanine-N7-)-methyltransferase
VGDAEPRLRRVTASDSLPISVQRPVTKYEGKAQHVGSAVAELLWEKRP